MKKCFGLAFVALLCCSWAVDAVASTLTEDEALQIVKNNRITEGLSNTSVNFYIAEVDTIVNNYRCPVDISSVAEAWVTDNTPKWMVFVDEEPLRCWSHDCNYYYIGPNNQLVYFPGVLPPEGLQSFSVERNLTVDNSNLPCPQFLSRPRLSHSVNNVNLLADSTYIVLSAQGATLDEERLFLRDIMLIYKMLTQVYGIDKTHLRVLTSFKIGEYVNPNSMFDLRMYYDLDGDSVYEYVEQCVNYVDAVKQFTDKQLYPNARHVFLYNETLPTGFATGRTNISQWATSGSGARILNVLTVADEGVTQDCRDEENKILTHISTQSERTTEEPYNQNVVAWVNALSQCDVFSGDTVVSDTDNNGYVSMAEAAEYCSLACSGNIRCTSLSPGLQNVVSFDHCPSSPALIIRDNVQDTGDVPNMNSATWNSPDIWYRNQDDGMDHQISEKLDESFGQYLYVRVNNNSDEEYEGYGQKLYLALACMESPVYEDCEMESVEFEVLDSIPITHHIAAHCSAIIKCPVSLFSNCDGVYNKIIASVGYCMPDYLQDNMYTDVPPVPTPKEDSHLAVSTLVVFDPSTGNDQWTIRGSGPVSVDRTCLGYDIPLSLGDVETIEINSPFVNANDRGAFLIGIQVPSCANASASGFRSESGTNIYILNGSSAQISSSSFANGNICLKIYTNGMIATACKKYCFDMVYRNSIGDILGGVSILLTVEGSGTGDGPIIMMSESNGNIELSATNLPTHASVNWYGENLEHVGESEVISIAPVDLQDSYTMIATEAGTGSLAIDSINLSSYNSILNAFVNGTDIMVKLARPAKTGTCLALTSCNANGYSRQILVENNSTDVVIPSGDIEDGVYILSLAVNGTVIGNRTFVK